ncbi:MAG: DUF1385 domain-containing protein [Clostridia bacterium]|nr:DUF1385 domain-containing protein [Clostridia bacterium]
MAKKCDSSCQEQFKTSIGGQALIEGIMMRGPEKQAIVVRTKEKLEIKVEPIKQGGFLRKIPFVRGVLNFFASMVSGVKALMYSANFFDDEEGAEPEKQSKLDAWLEKKMGSEKFMQGLIYFSAFLGIAFSVVLFFIVPIELGNLLERLTGCTLLVKNLFEGVLRIVIFLLYMFIVSKMKDMKRVFSYHGAEHKSIRCYEAKLPLTVENVRKQTRLHPRCGTSFLFVVMFISIILFTIASGLLIKVPFIGQLKNDNKVVFNLLMMGIKIIVMLPIVVSISYEFNRLVGRHDNWFTRILTWPGMWLQNFTTNEPDDEMIEVGIEALKLVIPEEEGADRW